MDEIDPNRILPDEKNGKLRPAARSPSAGVEKERK
jgi:hypothetical protein